MAPPGLLLENLSTQEHKIVVGIDFGTTYSGIAWTPVSRPDPDSSVAISSWPISTGNPEGESSEKVPTILHYPRKTSKPQWGFAIDRKVKFNQTVSWFKLDLDSEAYPGRSDRGPRTASGRTADDMITDYLSALIKHLQYNLQQSLGRSSAQSTPLDFVLTVPAIWNERAKDRTMKACQKALRAAKIQAPVSLISEPEAAATYALYSQRSPSLKVGDTFVVVDAGGGTVDLITYTITGLDPVLEVKETVPGSGYKCGSSYINRDFFKFLKAKIGHLEGFNDAKDDAMEAFETKIKRGFSKNDRGIRQVPVLGLQDDEALGIYRNRLTLEYSDIESFFQPKVDRTIRLVKNQIEQSAVPVKAVLLVGGFGRSLYLQECIRESIDSSIELLCHPQAWQAVVRGAVMRGIANSLPSGINLAISGRKARKHYGLKVNQTYYESKHSEMKEHKYRDRYHGEDRIKAMDWFITRGQEVRENEPARVEFYNKTLASSGRIKEWNMTIWSDSKSTEPPAFCTENVEVLANLTADLSSVPPFFFKRDSGKDGETYLILHGHVEMVHGSASTTYKLVVGKQVFDTVECEYV